MKKYVYRFKNPLLLSSILSFIFIILNQLEIVNLPNEKIEIIINGILGILVLVGIVNNPENKEYYGFIEGEVKEMKDSMLNNHEGYLKDIKSNFKDQDDWS